MPISPEDRCPGVLHALACRDGMLLRVRVPGGLIALEQFSALAQLARAHGDGFLDITARANVQLRGMREEALPAIADALATTGLLPSARHDRVRNIFASPFAGIDPRELLDVRPLLRAFDAALLADERFARLPAKFGFAFDGAGGFALDIAACDLALQAVAASQNVLLHLAIGGAPTGLGVPPRDAVRTLLEATLAALAYADAHDLATARAFRLRRLPDAAPFIRAALASSLLPCPAPQRKDPQPSPLGVLPANSPEFANVVPLIPLGRLSARQADGIIAIARRHNGEMRLAPWRGIVLGAMPCAALANVRSDLERLDLRLDASSGYAGIVACSGVAGCTKALADVRADAATIAKNRATHRLFDTTFNLAACEKRCAMPAGATIDLVATPAGYDMRVNGVLSRVARASIGAPFFMTNDYIKDAAAIYRASFSIIRAEANLGDASPTLARTVVRMIHACGMTDLPRDVASSAQAAERGRQALLDGAPILCDSAMLAAGVTRARLPRDNEVVCTLNHPDVPELAARLGTTRSAAALELWRERLDGSVVAIGNAPTALFHLLDMIAQGAPRPALVLGLPVGFVGAAESKRALAENALGIPYVVVHGRRGGSAMASAAINALASENE